jgi:hypothetical protein
MHSFYDIVTLTEFAQCCFGPVVDYPLPRPYLIGETKGFELAQTADFEGVVFVRLPLGKWREIDDAGVAAVAKQLAIELRPTFGLNLAFERAANVEIGTRSQFLGNQIASPVAHAFLDVVTRDDQILAVVAHAPYDQMNMGMLGIPVVDSDPVEPRAEILLHLLDQIAAEGFEVRHFESIVRRDDEPEMMPVILAACGECRAIDIFPPRPEQLRLLSVPCYALAPQIGEMCGK